MNIKQFKPLIGQDIYLIPTGNSVKRGVSLDQQIRKSKLLKVGRTNLTTEEGVYNFEGIEDKHNFGYKHFPTLQYAENYFAKKVWEGEIHELFRYGSTSLSYDQVHRIYGIINEELT